MAIFQIRHYMLLCTFSLLYIRSGAQFKHDRYDDQTFLIGMLNEYMGYQRVFDEHDQFCYPKVGILA